MYKIFVFYCYRYEKSILNLTNKKSYMVEKPSNDNFIDA